MEVGTDGSRDRGEGEGHASRSAQERLKHLLETVSTRISRHAHGRPANRAYQVTATQSCALPKQVTIHAIRRSNPSQRHKPRAHAPNGS